jgi:hypothetical protein
LWIVLFCTGTKLFINCSTDETRRCILRCIWAENPDSGAHYNLQFLDTPGLGDTPQKVWLCKIAFKCAVFATVSQILSMFSSSFWIPAVSLNLVK